MNEDQNTHGLKKALSKSQVWALAFGSIIGWGCFVLPGDSFLISSGPIGTAIGVAIGTLLMCTIVLVYGDMIKHAPFAGGEYAHTYIGFGINASFICGWVLVLGYISIVGANISALSLLVRYLLPGVFEFGELYTIAGWKVYIGEVLLMITGLLIFSYINYRGISLSGITQLIIALILSIGATVAVIFTLTAETSSLENLYPLFSENNSPFAAVIAIVAIAPWLFMGFDTASQSAEEYSFSPNKAKFIMIAALVWGAALYSMMTVAVAIVMPYPEMLSQMSIQKELGQASWATGVAVELSAGKLGIFVIAITMLAAVCTGILGFFVASTRLMLSMGRGYILPTWFADIHPKYHTPYKAILFTMALILIVPWCGRAILIWIVDMSSVGICIAYMFTCLTGYKVAKHSDAQNRKTQMILAIFGTTVSVVCIFLLLTPGSPAFISSEARWAMVVWCLLGVVFYMVSRKNWISQSKETIKNQILGGQGQNIPVYFKD